MLRGPQGTLYGAGAMGGLIKYTMKKPDPTQTEFRVGVGIVEHGRRRRLRRSNYRVGANLPLVQDSLALRASYASNDIAGYVDNLVDGREDINDGEQTSARASLLWQDDTVERAVRRDAPDDRQRQQRDHRAGPGDARPTSTA